MLFRKVRRNAHIRNNKTHPTANCLARMTLGPLGAALADLWLPQYNAQFSVGSFLPKGSLLPSSAAMEGSRRLAPCFAEPHRTIGRLSTGTFLIDSSEKLY